LNSANPQAPSGDTAGEIEAIKLHLNIVPGAWRFLRHKYNLLPSSPFEMRFLQIGDEEIAAAWHEAGVFGAAASQSAYWGLSDSISTSSAMPFVRT
jgi:hypothetical protein